MKHRKILARAPKVLTFLIIGLVVNIFVTVLTAQTGRSTRLTDEGCIGASYIISGIPIRDVFLREINGGECPALVMYNGDTGIRTMPYVLNWLFWSGASYVGINYFQQKHRKNKK